ncbi:hypothetical protein AB1Y20_015558 [Prymnesium parvum]|uniref:Uncharacterized protein n=1 Tax=Prymnesium parvum TaxID=97485 RepID=A0AB34K0K7_PRYPA
MCSSPSPPPRPQRRASTPGREGGGASGRTRSPRRGGGAKSLSRSASPAGSPRRGRACVPSSADDEAEILSSQLTVGANGQLSSGACACDVASQHRDLVKRYSEKCAQLREAHALRCSLELRIFQLQALGPTGASRQRLLAAEAAAEAAEAAVRAERERRRVREGQLLALLERGEVEAAKARLAAGRRAAAAAAAATRGGHGPRSLRARVAVRRRTGGGRRGEAPVEEAVIAAARAAAEAEAAALEAAMDSEEEEGGSTNDETDAVAAEADAEAGEEEEASADDQGSDVHSELHGEATRNTTCPPPAAKPAAAAASPLITCDDEDATDGTYDEKQAEAMSELESEDEEEQSDESEEDALLAGEHADDIEDDAVEAESEESEIESSASGEVSKTVPARLSSALQSLSVRGSDESLEIQINIPSSNQLLESSQRSDELDSNDDFLSRLARAESNPATPR